MFLAALFSNLSIHDRLFYNFTVQVLVWWHTSAFLCPTCKINYDKVSIPMLPCGIFMSTRSIIMLICNIDNKAFLNWFPIMSQV